MPGPAQTPMNLLKAGGSDFFSQACKDALQKAGYDPEAFGSYDHSRKYLATCRAKVKQDEIAKLEAAGKKVPDDLKLSENEKKLLDSPMASKISDENAKKYGQPNYERDANGETVKDPVSGKPVPNPKAYQAGHLTMNGSQQKVRGEPCENAVHGHDEGLAPCMPHQGLASKTGSEHEDWTRQEWQQSNLGRPENGGKPYPGGAAQCRKDGEERVQNLVGAKEPPPQPAGGGGAQAPGAGAGAASPDAAKEAAARRKKMDDDLKAGKPVTVDGTTAVECINNFRHMAEEQMKAKCKADADESPKTTPKGKVVTGKKAGMKGENAQKVADAEKAGVTKQQLDNHRGEVDQAKSDHAAAERQAEKLKHPDSGAKPEEVAAADQAVAQKKAALDAKKADYDKIGGDDTRNAFCMKDQGDKLNAGDAGAPVAPSGMPSKYEQDGVAAPPAPDQAGTTTPPAPESF